MRAAVACAHCIVIFKRPAGLPVPTVLAVDGNDLAGLSLKDAVDIFADLLWADARALGIPAHIDVPRNIHAPNGGIGATVSAPSKLPGPCAIRPGVTGYQIKTTRGLNPSADSARKGILYTQDGALRPRIRACLDKGGTFVIALFGSGVPSSAGAGGGGGDGAEDLMRKELVRANPLYENAKVEVWRQDRLIEYLERHPSLCRQLKGTAEVPFLDHHSWKETYRAMTLPFFVGPPQRRLIENARAALRDRDRRAAVRIVGRPGGGKTRVAHEITGDPELSSSVLYFERPDLLYTTNFLDRLLEDSSDSTAILVVDECGTEQRRILEDRTAKTGGRVRLVTICNERDTGDCYELEDLGLPEMRKIVDSYKADVPADAADKLARLCAPSPLYAHWLAEKMAADPTGLGTIPLAEDAIHEHYIGSGIAPGDRGWFRKRMSVLLQFGLFARVGHEGPCSHEYDFLRKKCGRNDGIAPSEFDRIVDELRRLRMLEGHGTLHIAPRMLHLWLWRKWWELHGHGSDADELVSPRAGPDTGDPMPDSLRRSFHEMVDSDPGSDAIVGAALALVE